MKCADTVAPDSSGYDAGKKIKGRKRHILTDTQGLLLGVVVTPASVQDRDAAKVVFCIFCPMLVSLRSIFLLMAVTQANWKTLSTQQHRSLVMQQG